ncbi:hypothetical protein NM688_g5924 [Phlebia brevispora]|uniref:Uncharacterized protein n=1 Tax=Phlebia brevispora TaxID=194682 RepID=A0ACC1SN28_9APHY|nr:hypothetical protein NM688_g5924 [Phlebia brevispora]
MADFNIKLSREELISALNHMQVAIPPKTKLLDEALRQRLKQALNGSQDAANTIHKPDLDISKLPAWPSGCSVYEATIRGDLNEALKIASARSRGGNDPFPLYDNPFMDLRQTVMSVAKNWDGGLKSNVVQDQSHQKCAINLRVVSVYKLDDKTPILLVLYMITTAEDPWPGVRWVQEQQRRDGFIPNISATEIELKMLAHLLSMNEKVLPAAVKLKKLPAEKGFKASFLLPLGPLSFEDVGKLNLDVLGCPVCGSKASKRCAKCQMVMYCKCQRADWPEHKKSCLSFKGGTWVTIPFTTKNPYGDFGYTANVNRFNTSRRDETSRLADGPPDNIHENNPFLIKLQIGGIKDIGNFLIYDRQRSFQVNFIQTANREVFQKLKDEAEGPRGGPLGLKMYRWAKRTGDFELSVCLDRAPQEEIKW